MTEETLQKIEMSYSLQVLSSEIDAIMGTASLTMSALERENAFSYIHKKDVYGAIAIIRENLEDIRNELSQLSIEALNETNTRPQEEETIIPF